MAAITDKSRKRAKDHSGRAVPGQCEHMSHTSKWRPPRIRPSWVVLSLLVALVLTTPSAVVSAQEVELSPGGIQCIAPEVCALADGPKPWLDEAPTDEVVDATPLLLTKTRIVCQPRIAFESVRRPYVSHRFSASEEHERLH
jgi:hypothetical protein